MRRVAPSVIAREQLQGLLAGGADRESNIVSALVETVSRLVVQELLEGEQRDFLGGRGRYDRRGEDQAGSRNGYERGRLRTAEGFVDVAVPQVRGAGEPFRSSLMGFLDGNSAVLESLVNEMYARGLSTRDVEDAFRDATGELLVSWGIAADGRKHLLHLAVGNKESEACWTEFFRSMLSRGLRMPTTITSDGAPGLVNAIEVCFPASIRIRCWFHRLANIRAKLPDEAAAEVMAHVYAVRDAPTLDAARAAADRLIAGYERTFPAAVACFADDLDALLGIHRVPVRHRIRVRTTNLAERSFVEERRRTKVIGRFSNERSAMKLVFATMIRAADRWCRVSITDLERHQLRLLRAELGLDPPPADTDSRRTDRRKRVAA